MTHGSFASLHLEDVVVNNAHSAGILIDGSQATLNNVVVRDTQSTQSNGMLGRGLSVEFGGQVKVSRSVFSNNREFGIYASGAHTYLKLQDVLVTKTQSRKGDRQLGIGLQVSNGAEVEVSRSVFSKNRDVGVLASETQSHLSLQNVHISHTQGIEQDGTNGLGLSVERGPQVEVSHSVFSNNKTFGVFADGANTYLKLHNVLVKDTQSQQRDQTNGEGLATKDGAEVEVSRSVFSNNRTFGISVFGPDTFLKLQDVRVDHTQSSLSGKPHGIGLFVNGRTEVEVFRSLFTKNRTIGILAQGTEAYLTLDHTHVTHTQSQESDGTFGRGLNIQLGANVKVSRSVFSNNREIGIFVATSNTHLVLQDVIIAETLKRECSASTCENFKGGMGLGSYADASVVLERFVFSKNALCGAQIARGRYVDESNEIVSFDRSGSMNLSNGIISNNEICGINIQTENINLKDLSYNSIFFDNNYNNLDTDKLYVPLANTQSTGP